MVLDAVANFVRGNTDAAVDSTQTTISVVDASIFPDPSTQGEYNTVIWDVDQYARPDQDPNVEVLRVTAIDTTNNDLTVTRGQEGTSGASHPSGSAIHLSPTAKMFSDIENTFADFWDATNQELTADVNNSAVTTTTASAGELSVTNMAGRAALTTNQSISTSTLTQLNLDSSEINESSVVEVDLTNNKLIAKPDGKYRVKAMVTWASSSGYSLGDTLQVRINFDGSLEVQQFEIHNGASGSPQTVNADLLVKDTSGTNSDVTVDVFHDAGQTEDIDGSDINTNVSVYKLG